MRTIRSRRSISPTGCQGAFASRPALDLQGYGIDSHEWLLGHQQVPLDVQWAREKIPQYAINTISYYACLTRARDQNEGQKGLKHQPDPENGPIKLLRLHGDCHPGNI